MTIVRRGKYQPHRKLTYNMVSCAITVPEHIKRRQKMVTEVSRALGHTYVIAYAPSIASSSVGNPHYVQTTY